MEEPRSVSAWAPGRVNLIGDHTDYTGGLALPLAIDLGTTVRGQREGDRVVLRSDRARGAADVPLDVAPDRVAQLRPTWARLVAGVVAEVRPDLGLSGTVTSTVPLGSGLSSSAALELAVALALGAEGTPLELAHSCQRAEQAATGVPTGILDQLASAAGVDGAALLIDCTTLVVAPVPLPPCEVVVVDSGQRRALGGTAYAERRAQCEAAERVVGPLREATEGDVERLTDPVLQRRARHVVTENARVRACAAALRNGDLATAGSLMVASHRSLQRDYEVSTPVLDDLVGRLVDTPGVHGARLTGAGFGGSVVALADPGTRLDGQHVRAVAGAGLRTGTGGPGRHGDRARSGRAG